MRIQTVGAIVGAAGLVAGMAAVGRAPFVQPSRMIHPVSGQPIVVPGAAGDVTLLFNGWKITPAGRHLPAGDMLLGAALSPDGTTLAVANAGYNPHAVHLIDLATEKEIARLPVDRAWNGIAWSPDGGRIYLSGGVENAKADVHVFEKQGDQWKAVEGVKLTGTDPKKTAIAGIAVSKDGTTVFVMNNSDDTLYVIGSADGAPRAKLQVGDHPGACRLSTDGKTLYVANWGGANISVIDVSTPSSPQVVATIQTGDHPNDIALSRDGRIFVSCGNSDSVTVIDTLTRKPIETIKTTFTSRTAPGATPNALALAQDNRTLYVANADNNNICVVDTSQRGASKVAGFIPTGWYPTAVAVSPDGAKVVACSGKGMGTRPNLATQPLNPVAPSGFAHMGRQLSGMISFVDAPNEEQLEKYTAQVRANTPYRDSQLKAANSNRASALPINVGDFSPIKYVLYIIKENRTYDQVFGDMAKGNSDPSLCLFGREVTPNHHALADQFVLLDNLYCSGEVSADGHPWSTSAYATDFTQRSWTLSYSGHGGTRRTDSVADPRAGYIWDLCNRKGLTYRSYGEYVYATSSEAAPEQKVAGAKGLIGHGSEKWVGIGRPKGSPMRDTDKADIFIEEFREFERTGTIPRFTIMSLGEDHTSGTKPGAYTPKSAVASNDVALGKIVDAISHSSAWKEFAIFVIEDDAQNGPDHVDSHRTVGLVVSPYTRRGYVDSTLYTTASMLRSMELILGMGPMTQYDAAATPMSDSFTSHADLGPFSALPARIDVAAKNVVTAYGARESSRMDFTDYDRVDEQALNRILWHSIKGREVPMPAPVHRALVTSGGRIMQSRSAVED